MPTSIIMDRVTVIRGNRIVLSQFSLAAGAGDIIWVRGANGSGKSTFLRLIAGLLSPVAGSLQIEGAMAMADESLALETSQTVEKAIGFWAELDGAELEHFENAMAAMDLEALADVPVRYLSSGQRRRATLARVIASGAPIWLLDEPYNGLDSANAARLDAALLLHAKSGGIAMVAAHQPPTINVAQSIQIDKRVDKQDDGADMKKAKTA
jgi:heme exporter protein A